jgi:hypothetical protein
VNAESYANWKNVYREFLKNGESKESYCIGKDGKLEKRRDENAEK